MAGLSTELRETERRVLGNLPAYRDDAGHAAAIADALEVGTITSAEQWPTGRTLADLTMRVAADRHSVLESGEDARVEAILGDLQDGGLVERDGDEYRMTEAGLAALTA